MALPSDINNYSSRMGPQYAPSSGAPASGVNEIILDAAQMAQASGDKLTVSDQAKLRADAWTLMPSLSAPDQTRLMEFLTQVQSLVPSHATGSVSTSGVLLTTPPKENPFTNGPNIMLIMMVLYNEMTKMANTGTMSMAKLQVEQMQAKLEAAIQTSALQVSSSEAQAQDLEAQADAARAAAMAALTQFAVSTVVTSVQVGMNLGARTKTDELAGYGKTDREALDQSVTGIDKNGKVVNPTKYDEFIGRLGDKNDSLSREPLAQNAQLNKIGADQNASAASGKDGFGDASVRGGQSAAQYANYTRSRNEDLMVYNKTLEFLTSSSKSLGDFISSEAAAASEIKRAELTRLKGLVDAAISMLQSLQETMSKGIDTVSGAKDAYKDMLQSLKQMVEAVFQLATKFVGRG